MNAKRRLSELEAELDAVGIRAMLKLEPDDIVIDAPTEVDRLLARSELRKKGVILAEPFAPQCPP